MARRWSCISLGGLTRPYVFDDKEDRRSMSDFIRSLSLGFLTRSLFAGAFFILGQRVGLYGLGGALAFGGAPNLSAFAALALLAGVSVNAVHRACFYPWVEWWLEGDCSRRLRERLIREETTDALWRAWAMEAEAKATNQERARRLASWGDSTHFLYVSALSLAAGAFTSVVILGCEKSSVSVPLLAVFLVLFVGALASDLRLKRTRECFEKRASWKAAE